MKKKILYLLITSSLLCILSGCVKKDNGAGNSLEHKVITVANDEYLSDIENSSTVMKSAKLLDALNQDDNIMISITSLNMALGVVLNGSTGETKEGIEKFLGRSTEDVNTYYKYLISTAKDNDVLNITNSIWIRDKDYKLNQTYNDKISQTFDAISKVIKFNNSGRNKINSYVKNKTNKMIPGLLDSIDPDASCYIINTILFDGKWNQPFTNGQVKDETFTDLNGYKNIVSMMRATETYYMENEYATGFKKSYKNEKYSFIGILPKKEGDIVVSDLEIDSLLESQTREYILSIGIPEFDFSTSVDLKEVLMNTELSNMFNESNNDIINIITNDNRPVPLFVSEVIQKTRIETTKEGTKASAVTAIGANTTSAIMEEKQRKEVILNRPFVFIIMDEVSQEPLFMGMVHNPSK